MHQDIYLVTLFVPVCQTEEALELHLTEIHSFFINDGGFQGTGSKLPKSFQAYPSAIYCVIFQNRLNAQPHEFLHETDINSNVFPIPPLLYCANQHQIKGLMKGCFGICWLVPFFPCCPPLFWSCAHPFHCSSGCKLLGINVWRLCSGSSPPSLQRTLLFIWTTYLRLA